MKLMAVDDDPTILELLEVALNVSGFSNITMCEGAYEALQVLREAEQTYDAFLLDVQMPRMDGIELCNAIRALPPYRRTPIIMVTAMSDKKYVNNAFAAGANDYINKPFDVLELGVRLKNNLQLHTACQRLHEMERKISGGDTTDAVAATADFDRATTENYLRQLSRCGAPYAVAGFAIANVDELAAQLSPKQFECMLEEFSRVFANQMEGETYLCSYVGHGTFVCIFQGSHNRLDHFLRASIENSFNNFGWRADRSAPFAAIRMGDVIRCRKFREVPVDLALNHAIRTAQATGDATGLTVLSAEELLAS